MSFRGQTIVPLRQVRYRSGRYYHQASGAGSSAGTNTNNRLHAIPIFIDGLTPFDRIAVNMIVNGQAGSTIRLGAYRAGDMANGDFGPTALLLDAGPIASDAGAAVVIFAPITLSLFGLVFLAFVQQGAPAIAATISRAPAPIAHPPMHEQSNWGGGVLGSGFVDGVAGALPDPFTIAGYSVSNAFPPLVSLRAA